MAGDKRDDEFESTNFNNNKKADAELKLKDQAAAKQQAAQQEYKKRIAAQAELLKRFRTPSEEHRVGGMVGKFIHLAELQAESLAGMAIMQYMMFLVSILVAKTHRENQAIFEIAKNTGLAYDPMIHKIYKRKNNNELDFGAPYGPHEKIPTSEIYANGYIPEPDLARSFQLEFFSFMEQQGGTQVLSTDILTELYGFDKAEKLAQGNNAPGKGGISREDQMVSELAKPKPKP